MRLGLSSLFVSVSAVLLLGGTSQAQFPRPRPHVRHRIHGRLPEGPGRLINRARGLCLDVAGFDTRGNANVHLWRCNGDPDQVWSFSPSGELVDAASGRALDAAGYDGRVGANVGVYRIERRADQQWNLAPRGAGTFELHNRARGMCLDVSGKRGANGDNVMLWKCDGGVDQLWSWQPAARPSPPIVRRAPPPFRGPPPTRPHRWDRGHAMGEHRFSSLLGAIHQATFSSDKLTVIREAASTNYFRVKQATRIISALTFSQDKLNALRALAPKLVDPKNAFEIPNAFTFSMDKQKAREIMRKNGF